MDIAHTIVKEDFFEDPDKIVNFANSLEYKEAEDKGEDYRWPGKRTQCLSETHYDFFNETVGRVIRLYYPMAAIDMRTQLYFQKVSSIFNDGWIHADNTYISFIVYLNKGIYPDGGTSLCVCKNKEPVDLYANKKVESFKNPELILQNEQYRLAYNSQYIESLRAASMYNRLIAFGGKNFHKANAYSSFGDNEPRLTLIGFVKKLKVTY